MGISRVNDFGPCTVGNVLDGMHASIRLPHEWSKRSSSFTADGVPCDPSSPAARSWCMTGALDRQLGQVADQALRDRLATETEALLLTTARRMFGLPGLHSLQQFNDDRGTTHEDVLELISEARAALPMPAMTGYIAEVSRSVNA